MQQQHIRDPNARHLSVCYETKPKFSPFYLMTADDTVMKEEKEEVFMRKFKVGLILKRVVFVKLYSNKFVLNYMYNSV